MRAVQANGSTTSTYFNGAAPARARNALHCHKVAEHGRTSTGPRPRGRGMAAVTDSRVGAEMHFNGAAPARARNDDLSQPCKDGTDYFNGAAPARARNGAGSLPSRSIAAILQRGRARAGAECTPGFPGVARKRHFNGAAPARARNVPRCTCAAITS